MHTVDFSRSFITFRIDTLKKQPLTVSHRPPHSLNNARIQVECRLEIVEKSSGSRQQFFLGANCKTERVGVDRDIWLLPNADFVPILSAKEFLMIKTYSRIGQEQSVRLYTQMVVQPDRQSGLVAEAFDSVKLDIVVCEGDVLETGHEITQAVLQNQRLTARTEFENEKYHAVIEYPIRTINVNERDEIYQTDTGPILIPDLKRDWENFIDGIELAFSAFSCESWIELICRVPTEVATGIKVYHYDRPVRYDGVKNQIICLAR